MEAEAQPTLPSSSSSSMLTSLWDSLSFELDWDELLDSVRELSWGLWAATKSLGGFPTEANKILVSSSKKADLEAGDWLLRLLLRCGANPDATDHRGNSVLSVSIQKNNHSLAELLLSYGANPSRPCSDGYGPLHSSVVEGSTRMVSRLLSDGASPFMAGAHGFTPLHTAVAGGRYGLVSLMITEAWNLSKDDCLKGVNALTDFGQSALHLAAHEAHMNCLHMLLRAGCNVNVKDFKGRTALDLAISRRHLNCVQILLKAGAVKQRKVYQTSPEILDELEKWGAVPSLKALAALKCRTEAHWSNEIPQNVPQEVIALIQLQLNE